MKQIENVPIYSAKEIAKIYRIHPYTAKRLARAGKLSAFKVGGQWRFRYRREEVVT